MLNRDVNILRELAKEVREITEKPIQNKRRDLWRKHNSFEFSRPLIYVRAFAFHEFFDNSLLRCEDPFYRGYEYYLHMMKFRDTIEDDFIIEPWLTVNAVYDPPTEIRWGVPADMGEKPNEQGAAAYKPQILMEEDFEKLTVPSHRINYEKTGLLVEKLKSAIGDILEVDLNRGSMFTMWYGDISTDIAKLRGLEQIMWDVFDRPEWFHRLLTFMRDGILKGHAEAELAGDFSLTCHQNQAMPYAKELSDPKPNSFGVKRKDLWCFMASQEYTSFGPEMFEEFLLRYQIPILEKFGMVAYGCCEDLTKKIGLLKKIPNLRRIAVSPFANVEKCAAQIGKDYILSWRPNPALMVSNGLDEGYVRGYMREHFRVFKEHSNFFDITLKDVETISHRPENIKKWVSIVREEIENGIL